MSIFYSKEQDGTLNVRVSGYLTKEPKVTEKVVLFSVCYGKKKYMDCKAWSKDTPGQIAACLEAHDCVAVDGTYEVYTKSDGTERKQIVVDGIFPMVVPYAASEMSGNETSEQTKEQPQSAWTELNDQDGEIPF